MAWNTWDWWSPNLASELIGIASVSTDPYCQSLKEMPTDLNPDVLMKELRHTSGQLNWIATQSRPDLA